MINVKKVFINPSKETFETPAVIIANHQSFLDILLLVMMHPKLILLTNHWVYNSPFFGRVVRKAGYYHVTNGNSIEQNIEELKKLVRDGYSIAVFPEGTRSVDMKIKRFHKGAFYLAEKLNLDIIPVLIHGSGYTMTKGDDFLLKNRKMTRVILPRIRPHDNDFGTTYSERTKRICHYFRNEYEKYSETIETTAYFKDQLIKNYLFKGNKVLHYLRVKLLVENNYKLINNYIPREAKIVDLGCGYGFLSCILSFVSEKRVITAIDWDEEKIKIAQNCPLKSDKLTFIQSDICDFDIPKADVYIIMDVLHYLPFDNQITLLGSLCEKVSSKGIVIVREGNPSLTKKHRFTIFTEFISKKIKFNKSNEKEFRYLTIKEIENVCSKYGMTLTLDDSETRYTSNVLYILSKK